MQNEPKDWRNRLYEIVDTARPGDHVSHAYDILMILCVVVSLSLLAFKTASPVFTAIDRVIAVIFFMDYILRFMVADKKMHGKPYDFLLFPFLPMSIIDLIAILPSLMPLTSVYRFLRLARILRALRIVRSLKMFRYSKNLIHLSNVFRREKVALFSVCTFVVAYILIVALIVLNLEPQTFDTYLDAVYWATISLTTIGYGDIYPSSDIGRIVTIVSSLVGILVIALPTGIITAGIMQELNNSKYERRDTEDAINRMLKQTPDEERMERLYEEMVSKMEELEIWERNLIEREYTLERQHQLDVMNREQSEGSAAAKGSGMDQ